MYFPKVIQGGMGAGVSDWRLAQAVSRTGQLGVVSGTALEVILARRLQDGDPGGHMRRALDHFPFAQMAERVWNTYYIPAGKQERESYRAVAMHQQVNPRQLNEELMVANFVEVFLAREGHGNPVGINYLEKIQLPLLPSIYGAMLAGVDAVLMGAGIPLKLPGVLDCFANHEPAAYPLAVTGGRDGEEYLLKFDPSEYIDGALPPLRRPMFLSIISSNVLATTMVRRANGKVDGFIIEGPTAGGHNAPPRGKLVLNEKGEAVYGERDRVDLGKIREIGLPFWLAGGYGSPDMLSEALAHGAAGIQVGTAFAYCAESGLREDYKAKLLSKSLCGEASVFTDPNSSPTGFPFKAAQLEGTASERDVYLARPRICDVGQLRETYRQDDGIVGYRCAAEPVSIYLAKGGRVEDTVGRKCLCNALLANIGQPQVHAGKHVEVGLVTSGDDLVGIGRFVPPGQTTYTAAHVVSVLLGEVPMTKECAFASTGAVVEMVGLEGVCDSV
jgi:nitronate monooxygenase